MTEGLERMLLRKLLSLKDGSGHLLENLPDESMTKVTNVLANRSKENLGEALGDAVFQTYMADT